MMAKKVSITMEGAPLIKFQSRDKIEKLQKGYLYGKTLSYYRKLEEETGDAEIGDLYEGMLPIKEGYLKVEGSDEVIEIKNQQLSTTDSNLCVFCMFGFYTTQTNFSFSELQKEKMLSFGDSALMILNTQKFISRIEAAAEQAGYKAYFGPVKYYDPSYDNLNMIIEAMGEMQNLGFWKRDSYAYQQEARFIFLPKSDDKKNEDHIELEIGDISDISEIFPSEMVLTGKLAKQ